MTLLLDTSVLVATGGGGIESRAGEADDAWHVSVVTIGELEAGVLLARDDAARAARLRRLSAVLAATRALALDLDVAIRYGQLRAASGRRPTNDLWIAATAMAHDLTLLTRDAAQASLPLVRTRLLS